MYKKWYQKRVRLMSRWLHYRSKVTLLLHGNMFSRCFISFWKKRFSTFVTLIMIFIGQGDLAVTWKHVFSRFHLIFENKIVLDVCDLEYDLSDWPAYNNQELRNSPDNILHVKVIGWPWNITRSKFGRLHMYIITSSYPIKMKSLQ